MKWITYKKSVSMVKTWVRRSIFMCCWRTCFDVCSRKWIEEHDSSVVGYRRTHGRMKMSYVYGILCAPPSQNVYRRTPGNEFHDVTGQSCTLQIRIWTHMKRPRFLWNVKVWFTSDWGPLQGQKRFLFFFTFHMGSWVSSFKPWKFRHEHFSGLRLKQFRGKIMKSHRHLWLITVHWMDIFCVHVQSRIPILIVSIHIKS